MYFLADFKYTSAVLCVIMKKDSEKESQDEKTFDFNSYDRSFADGQLFSALFCGYGNETDGCYVSDGAQKG